MTRLLLANTKVSDNEVVSQCVGRRTNELQVGAVLPSQDAGVAITNVVTLK
jgi:hypothetical protein